VVPFQPHVADGLRYGALVPSKAIVV
jgi:hypothetical protein